jgi:hypothetical protein
MLIDKNWTATKSALLDGLSESASLYTGILMENQRQYLMETAPAAATGAADISSFQNILVPMIRRIMTGTIAPSLVGVQAMKGPSDRIYSLRFAFAEAADGNGDASNDISAGDEAFVNNSKMKRFYSTANAGTAGYPPALTANTSAGIAATTSDFEGYGGRGMRLSVLNQTVTAGSRALSARWTMEADHDLSTQHGVNIQNELTAALSAQIAREIDNEILTDLLGLAGTVGTYDFAAPPSGFSPNFIGDRYAELGVLINRLANQIGAKTNRGPGNWLVGSHLITSILQSASKSVFAPVVQGTFSDPTGNKLVGVMNNQMKVYSYVGGLNDAWGFTGANNAMGSTGEDILIGYKGGASELDTGYFYCPYVPLVSTGVVMDAQTFTPAISLRTRYGKATFVNTSSSLGNSADYYSRVRVLNVAFS